MTLIMAAFYAGHGWPVFPCQWAGPRRKHPLTAHGLHDATRDSLSIKSWWHRWPCALIGTPTGHNFVALDIDVREDRNGWHTLDKLEISPPATRSVLTPSGGVHLHFLAGEHGIRNTAGDYGRGIGKGLDWRGMGGYVIIPSPDSGYSWGRGGIDAPLASVPAELVPKDKPPDRAIPNPADVRFLDSYVDAATRSACRKISSAQNGQQDNTLYAESFCLGSFVAANLELHADAALAALLAGVGPLTSYNPNYPWTAADIERKVRRGFNDGLNHPRRGRRHG